MAPPGPRHHGDTSSAGTNGNPAFRFNPTTTGVRALNPPSASAFDAGHVDTYDLRLFNTPSQITMLRIGIAGSDDWCVKKIELLFNGRVAFAQDAVPGGACAAINAGTYLEYSSSTLRNNPSWAGYGTPPALPSGMTAATLRAVATSVTGSAMLSSPGVRWDPAKPLTVVRKSSTTLGVSFGVVIYDPSGIESPFTATITYDVRLSVGSDGNLHATKTNASCCYHYSMSDAVVAHLDTSLSRMTARPAPHNPLRFAIDAFTNITWSYPA